MQTGLMRLFHASAVSLTVSVCLGGCADIVAAASVTVGGVELELPAPRGFVAAREYRELVSTYEVEPQNELLAVFIKDGQDAAPRGGERIPGSPYFLVQADRNLIPIVMSENDYVDLASFVRERNEEFVTQVQRDHPGLITQLEDAHGAADEVRTAVGVRGLIPFPALVATDRVLAYSYIRAVDPSDDVQALPSEAVAVTVSLVHVQGKVLLLQAVADGGSLEWTRRASERWAAELVSVNSGEGGAAIEKAERVEGRPSFDVRPIDLASREADPGQAQDAVSWSWCSIAAVALLATSVFGLGLYRWTRRRPGVF